MKNKMAAAALFFLLLTAAVTGGFYLSLSRTNPQEYQAEQVIAVNEIEQLAKAGNLTALLEKTHLLKHSIRTPETPQTDAWPVLVMGGICAGILLCVFGFLWFSILRPFEKMKKYVNRLAAGNFDIPLDQIRSNYLKDFTWAFDNMRFEITKARSCEREAIENNKTVIATLSHDLRTPIASIRAYAEGLEAHLEGSAENRAKYLNIIMRKCDEVAKLTNDLFLHSISDLDKLKIIPGSFEFCGFFEALIDELSAERHDIIFTRPDFQAMVWADENRLTQIVENLINNARKYAKTPVFVFLTLQDGWVFAHFKDQGNGIPDEDIPFIFDKFYRGKNCCNQPGSGLGLYIVKYLAEKMNGRILLHNRGDGLEAVLGLPINCPL